MNERLKEYIELVFSGVPSSQQVQEMKDELLANLNDKYNDLIAKGKTPEEAYSAAIAGMGDISELLRYAHSPEAEQKGMWGENAPKLLWLALGIFMVILAASFFGAQFIGRAFWGNRISGRVFLSMGIASTVAVLITAVVMLVYMQIKHKTFSRSTFVQQFIASQPAQKRREIERSITSIFWAMVVAVYILVSFATRLWYITWIIFLIAPAIQQLISLLFTCLSPNPDRKRMKRCCIACLWLLITTAYFVISFTFGNWHLSWIIFLIGAALSQVVSLGFKLSE